MAPATVETPRIGAEVEYVLLANGFTPPAGSLFAGWDKGAAGETMTIDSDTRLVAQWQPAYTVSFDANGGSGKMDDVLVPVSEDGDTPYVLPANGFTPPDGATFDGWDKGDAGDTITLGGDTAVKAKWAYRHTVTFDSNGGSGKMEPKVFTGKSDTFKLPENGFTPPDGCVFAGWDRGKPGDEITVDDDVTVRAMWSKADAKAFTVDGIPDQAYTGEEICPDVVVRDSETGDILVEDRDYTVSYSDNIEPGVATAHVVGIGDYEGAIDRNFNILKEVQPEGEPAVKPGKANEPDNGNAVEAPDKVPPVSNDKGSQPVSKTGDNTLTGILLVSLVAAALFGAAFFERRRRDA